MIPPLRCCNHSGARAVHNLMKTLIPAILLVAGTANASWFSDCEHRTRRSAQLSPEGITRIIVIAKAGELKVEGRNGGAISAVGDACSSDEELLRDITL